MQFVPTQPKLHPEERTLLQLFAELDDQNKRSLIAFAEFLASRDRRDPEQGADENTAEQPKPIPRPSQESVVKAIKRLSTTYFMLDRKQMLDKTSSLMMSHVIQGRDAVSVIDDLEDLFTQHYQHYLDRH